jgi:phage tail sheath protein FI
MMTPKHQTSSSLPTELSLLPTASLILVISTLMTASTTSSVTFQRMLTLLVLWFALTLERSHGSHPLVSSVVYLNNAVKLAYNPQNQRDELYQARVNPISFQPGIGILLFGDKTALGYASAFDRINVRRLFLTVEQALEGAAKAQLFELNDEITRANFVNIVEPYLRDVQAKRGLYDFLVICDETNNTPDVIDNNEFRADIFLKPAKSINYVSLTFVATRTGVSFEEVAGRV